MTLYRNRPVFDFPLDWSSLPTSRIEYDLAEIAVGFGAEAYYSDQNHVIHGWQVRVCLDTPPAIDAFDAFTAGLHGRLVGFWFPTPTAAFRIIAGVSATAFDIAAGGLAATWTDHPGAFLWFTQAGQPARGAKIADVSDNGNGTERVRVEESVSVDDAWQAWILAYVRLADDAERGEFVAEGRLVRTVQVVELPAEYADIETGSKPVYLYDLWVGEGDGKVEWYWTSFPWELEDVLGKTYLARRITHGSIHYDTTGVRQGVHIEVERTDDSPFARLFPPHGCQPLNIRIRMFEQPNLAQIRTLFEGVVDSVQADGKRLRARCHALTGMQASVPAFFFSSRCQHRVFDSGSCGLSRSSWQKVAVIAGLAGRSVTVSGSTLSGLSANWFAEGWLEVGSGIGREVRLVLANTAESAGAMTLTLNAPLRFSSTGFPVTLMPGCDGRWVTCLDKFGNTVRYGGHRFALRNLAIKALEIPANKGGKK